MATTITAPDPSHSYCYHYSGLSQIRDGSINYYDGFLTRPTSIRTNEDCNEIKKFIAGCHNCPPKKLCLTSLTLVSDPLES